HGGKSALEPELTAEQSGITAGVGLWVARVLQAGVYGSAGLLLFGLALALVRPAPAAHYALAELPEHLARLEPAAVMQSGIALLLLTPVLRVAVAVVSFARQGDYRYSAVAGGVLMILLFSILLRMGT